jgi:hypothetical protein
MKRSAQCKAGDGGLFVCGMVWLHRFFSLTVERLVLGLGERDSAFLARFAFSVPFRFRLLVVCRIGGSGQRRERSFVRSFRELHRRC